MFASNEKMIEARSADFMRIICLCIQKDSDTTNVQCVSRWKMSLALLSTNLRGLVVVVCRLRITQIFNPLFLFFGLCLFNVITQQIGHLRSLAFDPLKVKFKLRNDIVDSCVDVCQLLCPGTGHDIDRCLSTTVLC